jgi:magnesium-transporting ATPase (P-type)
VCVCVCVHVCVCVCFVRARARVCVGVCVILIAMFQIKYPLLTALIFAIGLITANVPEGLLPQLTIILTLCARRMKDINVLVKTLDIMETLGCTSCIASDKTGTLTQNKMTVSHVYYGGKINNSGGNAVSGAHYPVFDKADTGFCLLQRCATVCNRAVFVHADGEKFPNFAEIQNWKVHGDASEAALIKFCHPLSDIMQYVAARMFSRTPEELIGFEEFISLARIFGRRPFAGAVDKNCARNCAIADARATGTATASSPLPPSPSTPPTSGSCPSTQPTTPCSRTCC